MSKRLAVSLRAVSVRRGARWVLRNISWQLQCGERWALLGENGAGKTQLLKLVSGDVWPTPSSEAGRDYRAAGRCMALLEAKRRIAYVGSELQDKYARYGWNLRVRDLVATGLHGTDLLLRPVTRAQRERVDAMLRSCGLLRFAQREFLALSYGEQRLALLARALVQQPDWLLLDEFYNGLDEYFRRRLDALLATARRRGQAWVATAHRAGDVPAGTELLLRLARGEVAERGPLEAVQLMPPAAQVAAAKAPRRARRGSRGKVLIELSHVDLYVDYRLVLRGVSWRLRRGEHWAVFGANGAGKSSFLKLLYGDLAPALGGSVVRDGVPRGTPISAWKRRVGLVSPELQSAYAIDVSLLELVASGPEASIGLNQRMTAAQARHARRWLAFFELQSRARCKPRELSYGQMRRALIARAMAAAPRVLLLDEPLTGLDPRQRSILKRVLRKLMRRQVALVAAVHHQEDLPQGITHALHLHKRRALAADFQSAT